MHGLPDDLFGYRLVRARVIHSAGEQVSLGPHPAVVFAERTEPFLAQGNFPVDAALALYNTKHHALAVYVSHLETAQLSAAQARRVKVISMVRC